MTADFSAANDFIKISAVFTLLPVFYNKKEKLHNELTLRLRRLKEKIFVIHNVMR